MRFNGKVHKTASDYLGILQQNGAIFLSVHAGQNLRTQTVLLYGASLRSIGRYYKSKKHT